MHDFKYLQLVSGKAKMKAFFDALDAVRSEALRPVAIAFASNIERLKNMAVSPAEIAQQARRDASWVFYAEYLVTGKIRKPFSEEAQLSSDEVIEKFQALLEEFISRLTDNDRSYLVEKLGVDFVDAMLKDTPGMEKGMEAFLSSMVIGYWAAFEALAPDLWKSAINNGPVELSTRINLATQDKPDSKIAKHWGDNLQGDIRKDYGGGLIEGGRVSFRTLDRIIQWYAVTFKDEGRRIFKDNPDIYAVAAYRNAFVHNSGRVDRDFIKQIEPIDNLRGKFKVNDALELDGEIVNRLRDAICSTGLHLIQLADDLMSPKSP